MEIIDTMTKDEINDYRKKNMSAKKRKNNYRKRYRSHRKKANKKTNKKVNNKTAKRNNKNKGNNNGNSIVSTNKLSTVKPYLIDIDSDSE